MTPEELLQFKVPEVSDLEVYVLRLSDGKIVARTKEELEELKEEGEVTEE